MPEGLKAVDTALDRVASRMTPVIQNRAVEAGWPENVAARLSMTRSENTLAVTYDGDPSEAADLEFGTPDSSPRSILTKLETPAMKQEIRKSMLSSLDEIHDRVQAMFA